MLKGKGRPGMEQTITALKIFKILLHDGQLEREREPELFMKYMEPAVQDVLNGFEEELECRIMSINNTIYLLPDHDNDILGFRNKDMREWLGSNARLTDVYLAWYITLFVFHQFYGGKNKNPKQREFIRIAGLIEELDARMEAMVEEPEAAIEQEQMVSMNFLKAAENWLGRRNYEDKRMTTTKYGFVLRVCRLLEQEKLIRLIDEGREIRTTKKLDDLMIYHYLNDSRVNEINSVFRGGSS